MTSTLLRLLSWLFCCVLACQVSAQTVLSGRVTDTSHNALSGISVTLHPPAGTPMIAFGITDKDGKFSIPFMSDQDSIRIKAYGLGWATQEKQLLNRSQNVTISLLSQPIVLKEVKVRPSPITRHRDTIAYSVDAFKNQSDRVIADVIRKLPGIEVENDGRILYQGKPINKYYIEGIDLLENKYRLANDNLPADAVLQVEVIENHQPIRMLDSLVFSDRAALNIRLKNNVTVTGTAHAGVGGAPLLWDANLTPMLFTRTNQFIASYQSNNVGINVARQLKNLSPGTVFNPLQNDDEKKDWVSIQPLITPVFDETRWLNNNIHIGTLNYLKKLASDFEIRCTISYTHDYQQQRGRTTTIYYTPTDTINLLENTYNQLYFHSLETRLTLQKNNTRNYLKNELAAKANWDSQQGLILLNRTPIEQAVSNPFFWLTNTFTDIIRARKTLFTVTSITSLNRAPQSLAVTPGQYIDLINQGNAYQQITQYVLATSFSSHNSISFTKRLKRFVILPELGFALEKQGLRSDINYSYKGESKSLTEDFANRLDWFKLNAFLKLKVQYQKNAWRLELDSPVTYYRFDINDTLANESQKIKRLVVEPRFKVNYTINPLWTANASLSYRNGFGELDDVYYGYLLDSYRRLQRKAVPLQNNQTISGSVSLDYRNPLTSLFGSLFYSYSRSNNNLLYQSRITPTGAMEYLAINQSNNSNMQLMNGQASKYLAALKTTISAKLVWTTMTRSQLVNGSFVDLTNQNISPGLSISTNFNKVMDIDYGYKRSIYTTRFSELTKQTTSQQKHTLKVNLYANRKSYISLENEYYVNNLITGRVNNFFANLLFRYALPKRKIDLETRWSNIWNTSLLTTGSLTSFSYIESVYELRPMQIIQKIRFSF